MELSMPNEVKIWDGTQWVLVSGLTGRAGNTGGTGNTGQRGSRWYTGAGSPNTVPLAEWTPSGVDVPPLSGDFYLNTVDGSYSEMT
jgi:hypothetical protein